jgi:hypothetical protein
MELGLACRLHTRILAVPIMRCEYMCTATAGHCLVLTFLTCSRRSWPAGGSDGQIYV